MDYTLATWRNKKDGAFAAKYGDVKPPRDQEVWNMIYSGVGAAEQHRECTQGRHDFEWYPEISEQGKRTGTKKKLQ